MKPKPNVTDALRAFAVTLDSIGIAADDIEISLPFDDWQRLAQRLDAEKHEEPGTDVGKIRVAGVRYLIRSR